MLSSFYLSCHSKTRSFMYLSSHSNGSHPHTQGTSSLKEEVPGVWGCGPLEREDEVLRISQNNVRFCSNKKKIFGNIFIFFIKIYTYFVNFKANLYLSWNLPLRNNLSCISCCVYLIQVPQNLQKSHISHSIFDILHGYFKIECDLIF